MTVAEETNATFFTGIFFSVTVTHEPDKQRCSPSTLSKKMKPLGF